MNTDQAQRLTSTDQWFRYWMPYQFVKLKSHRHRHTYLPLNRNYKPLGQTGSEWVNYDDYADQAIIFSSDPNKFKDVWHDVTGLYLYEDNPDTRTDYFVRLERLFSHSVGIVARADIAA